MKKIIPFAIVCITLIISSCKKKKSDDNPPLSTVTYKDTILTSQFQRTSGMVAGDAAVSIPLNNGKSLWLFGDSYIDNYDAVTKTVPCLFQVRNAGLLMDINNNTGVPTATTLLGTGTPRSYFMLGTNNAYWFWPGAGYQRGDTAYVFLVRLRNSIPPGGFVEVDSQYVAKIKVPEMIVAGFISFGSRNNIHFLQGAVNDGGFYYVYGIRDNGFGRDVFVARYPESNIYAPWEYHSASGWTTNINSAVKIHDEFTSSFHVLKVAGKYIMITTQFSVGCNQGKEIYSYTSANPHGPFINKKKVWILNDTLQGHFPFFYLAYAHPEYDNGKRELLITYCINSYGTCVSTCISNRFNPDYYRPKAIRVPYSIIGL